VISVPNLNPELQGFVRVGYGVLMLLTLGAALPHAQRYFRSERWGGYAESSPSVDAIQNPTVSSLILVAWIGSALCLATGRFVSIAAATNLAFCYYFFIRMRWRSVLRGMGAPGFIAFWLGAAVFLLELTSRHAPGLRGLALLTLQIDFAAIMLSAGLYKFCAGYRRGQGMELGMVNPEWGYWPEFWATWRPSHPLFRFLDQMAWGTEVACGVLMLIPATRMLGGLGILLSFIFIATQIRLGFLCEMVILCSLLFFGAGTAALLPVSSDPLPAAVQSAIAAACWSYIALLPVVRTGMFYNQLRHRRLPAPIQRALDGYANVFGLILWRVFTADVVNFFVRVWEEPSDRRSSSGGRRSAIVEDGGRRPLSDYEGFPGTHRFRQVAECITLTSVFTTLKYYPTNRSLFTGRLLRYARTIPHASASRLVFEWVNVAAMPDRFAFVPIAEYAVDVNAGTVTDSVLSDVTSVYGVPSASPVHEGVTPGSYAPLNPRT
jgi:hypothetical protein